MQRIALLAAAALLAVPAAASAAPADPLLDAFRNICVAHTGNYVDTVNAAKAGGWTEVPVNIPDDPAVAVSSKSAMSLTADGASLTLVAVTGLQHMKAGDTPVTSCRIESNKSDADAIGETTAWLGVKPDGGDSSLAYYFMTGSPDHLTHNTSPTIPPGGLSLIKVQLDSGSAILVDQFFAGKP